MPTYDYGCVVCKEEFETVQSIKDEVGAQCPKCQSWSVNRLISDGTCFTLKGGGWAADNYSTPGGNSNNS